jgi:hypothetical protein
VTDVRHLDLDRLQDYLDAGVRAIVPIIGSPAAFLIVDPEKDRISVRVEDEDGVTVTPSSYRRISTRNIIAEGRRWSECSVDGFNVALEGYPVLCAVVDRMQNEAMNFDNAVVDAVASFRAVLQGIGQLSEQEEIGLVGELLVLSHLVSTRGDEALPSWRGFAAEEHDFDLGPEDLEVKTTTSERRRHWISSITQLQPTPNRPLWLLSIQLTGAAPGVDGFGLGTLVESLRRKVVRPAARTLLENQLGLLGADETLASLYTRRFRLRTPPKAFEVSTAFPAITPTTLESAGLRVAAFPRVTYQVDLTGVLVGAKLPAAISGLCEGTGVDV